MWKVKEFANGEPVGDEKALKDYWIPEDSKTEGEIQDEIFLRAGKGRQQRSDFDDFKKYFMTIKHNTVVKVSGQDDTSYLPFQAELDPSCGKLRLPSQLSS